VGGFVEERDAFFNGLLESPGSMFAEKEHPAPDASVSGATWSELGPAERLALVDAEMRAIARGMLARERPGHTLQTTALVNEAWIRVRNDRHAASGDRKDFLLAAARSMRRILLDLARRRGARVEGADELRIELEPWLAVTGDADTDLIALDVALDRLASELPEDAELVELRFFGGREWADVALLLEFPSPDAARKRWEYVRARLRRDMERGHA
jgi:RNA polymerase sigma factor (TIGR02999 family)